MKIIVMSDTHLTTATDGFRSLCSRYCNNADMVIHLGDWVSNDVLNFMEQHPLEAVAGNTDDAYIHSRLPDKKVIRVNGFRLGLIHGWGAAPGIRARLREEFTDVDAILHGHTHQPYQMTENGIFWFNPGSVTMGRGEPHRSLGILHIQDSIRSEIVQL
ncbi:MAG: metallophosphoesterase family protein [Syntrophobacteraceae bacterium]